MMRHFKKILPGLVLCLSFCLFASPVLAAPDATDGKTGTEATPDDKSGNLSAQDVQNEMKNVMQEMLSITGAMVSGMAAGMQEGAEKTQAQLDGADGTRLISNKKDLAELVQVTIFKLEEQGNGSWRVTLAIKNTNDFPVRLTNLTRKQSVLLLDAEGFAHDPVRQDGSGRMLTVAARAAIKASFDFSGLEERPGIIRLFDTDFPVQ